MTKSNLAIEDQPKQQKGRSASVTAEGQDQIYGGLLERLARTGNNNSSHIQARHLNDRRFQTAQRQAMAKQIGRTRGNQYLQRVISASKQPHSVARKSAKCEEEERVQRLRDPYAANQPTIYRCAACEEESKVQRKPALDSSLIVQRWSLFGEEEESSNDGSGGGVLDWVGETASGAIDSVTEASSDAYDWATDQGGAAVDAATQAGDDAYNWAAEQGSSALDTITETGSDIYNWAAEQGESAIDTVTETGGNAYDWIADQGNAVIDTVTEVGESVYDLVSENGAEYMLEMIEQKKSALFGQISGAMQKFAGQGSVKVTDTQIATLNNHLAQLRSKSQGSINIPGIAVQSAPEATSQGSGTSLVAASSITNLLQQLHSSLSSPFFSPALDSSHSNSGTIQRAAVLAAPVVVGAGLLAALETILLVLLIIAAILIIIMVIAEAIERAKEDTDEATDEEECERIHSNYKALGNCPSCKPTDTSEERAAKILCLTSVISGRTDYLDKGCDYILEGSIRRGSEIAERGHRIQVEQLETMLRKCQTLPTT